MQSKTSNDPDAPADRDTPPQSWRKSVLFAPAGESANGFHIPPSRPSILHLFDLARSHNDFLRVAAPMVRYSKLPFRATAREYGTDVCFTPMIMSGVFKERRIARDVELETNDEDHPLVVQFAANNAEDLVGATEYVARHVEGVDINCGCPQRWAIEEGIGCALMESPELVRDMVKQVKARTDVPISIKIRLHTDLRRTVDLAQRAEHVGAAWVGIHGRTRRQRSTEEPNMDGVAVVASSLSVPTIVNGSVTSLSTARSAVSKTGCWGAMSARGLLANPAMFDDAEYATTPIEAVQGFVKRAVEWGMQGRIAAQQVAWMMEGVMTRQERRTFNALTSLPAILDYFEEHYGIIIA
ncbi:FMN-linked oxidoreductase [Gonapodya prolifera JEL478]|uniref:FMN-linked oxidoreductase n=1 Tax=Gonapodya prolifera (strain JEL478) TaxID=1344416 RepID=A0A139AX16_GONPJ|nr:FMN-linked oxidoreductase [Gonapodya prolifera JEL478]|eukprot:KXS21291.1 FMN-linked oxidoreductase [Gonapodya prolifera JEL478]